MKDLKYMKQEQNQLKTSFEKELGKIKDEVFLSPEYRKKKTIIWVIRTIIAVVLFVVFLET